MRIAIAFIFFIVLSKHAHRTTSWDVKLREDLNFNWIHQLEGSYLYIAMILYNVMHVLLMKLIKISEANLVQYI